MTELGNIIQSTKNNLPNVTFGLFLCTKPTGRCVLHVSEGEAVSLRSHAVFTLEIPDVTMDAVRKIHIPCMFLGSWHHP